MDNKKELISLDKSDNSVLLSVNPKIYSLDVIYSAAYVFLDKAYILLDGDPEKEVVVRLRLKEEISENSEKELKKLGNEFFNELLNYSFYKKQAEKNSKIRETLLQTALIGSSLQEPQIETSQDEEFIEDPEGIAIPWEEKYGKLKKNSLENSKNKELDIDTIDSNKEESKKG